MKCDWCEKEAVTEEQLCEECDKHVNPDMKTKEQIRAKAEEMFQRVWLMRSRGVNGQDEEQDERIIEAAKKVIAEVPMHRLQRDSEFPGALEGWLAALRWVLDENVTEESDWIYDS